MLPSMLDCPTRIMRYGYHSQWFGQQAIRQTVATVADRLLLSLKKKRKVVTIKSIKLVLLSCLMRRALSLVPSSSSLTVLVGLSF